ncbi:MAG: hypothetical protein ACI9OJ_000344 [Myxococcota bacterium]
MSRGHRISNECVESTECRPCRAPGAGELFDPTVHDFALCPNQDICNPTLGCFDTYKVEGTACAEAPCMEPSACNAEGECIASNTPKTCDDGDACTTDSCNPDTGDCVNTPTVCDDGDACTAEACNTTTGECDAGEAKDCSDADLCTDDTCDAQTGNCLNTPKVCEDEDPCTENSCDDDTGNCEFTNECDDGVACTDDNCVDGCESTPKVCDDGDLCTTDSCDPVSGECIFAPVVCDDQDICTVDVCTDGDCSSTPKDCSDNDDCTMDICNLDTGVCGNPPVGCDDDDNCTVDACAGGQCSNTPVDCNDDDACTTDACEGDDGSCQNVAIECDDSSLCTTDLCVAGDCVFAPKTCPTGAQCEVTTCDGETGDCGLKFKPDNIPDSSCCSPGQVAGCDNPVCETCVCDAFPECCGDNGFWAPHCATATESVCAAECSQCNGAGCCAVEQGTDFPLSGCSNEPCESCVCALDPSCCTEDGWNSNCSQLANNECGYSCTQCTGVVPCDDGNICTEEDTCGEGCSGQTKDCNDNNECTFDGCDGVTGECTNVANACDDSNPCTIDECVQGNEGPPCENTPKNCGDENECTTDQCNETTGDCENPATSSDVPTSSCCSTHGGSGCDIPVCQDCVCELFPFCCDNEQGSGVWGEFCALAAEANCETECAVCSGAACCDVPSGNDLPFSGCSNTVCETCVCDVDFGCCDGTWDDECSAIATTICALSCTQCQQGCDDDNLCTNGDVCNAGVCIGEATECSGGSCEVATCDPETGSCGTTIDETLCDDSSVCTTEECVEGDCQYAQAIDCGDGNSCTSDNCDPATGVCSYDNLTTTSAVPESSCCFDQDTEEGNGSAGCDNDPCEACVCGFDDYCCDTAWDELCVAQTELCPAECGSVCNGIGCCTAIGSEGGGPPGCSNDICEACVVAELGFCALEWAEPCADIANTTCISACNQCGGSPCSDANSCTSNDICDDGTCVGTLNVDFCDDEDECTIDTCDAEAGCDNEFNSEVACDDSNACTKDFCGEVGGCVNSPKDCGDQDPCTTDACDTVTGDCSNPPLESPAPASSCCSPSGGAGCDDAACATCVCQAEFAYCCDGEGGGWDEDCVLQTAHCATECAVCEGTACCEAFDANNFPFSGCAANPVCETCVCELDASCCGEGNWDGDCAVLAKTECLLSCTQCQYNPACDDGNFCTVGETCGIEGCGSGSQKTCDDGLQFTFDFCDSEIQTCVNIEAN